MQTQKSSNYYSLKNNLITTSEVVLAQRAPQAHLIRPDVVETQANTAPAGCKLGGALSGNVATGSWAPSAHRANGTAPVAPRVPGFSVCKMGARVDCLEGAVAGNTAQTLLH